MRLGLQPTLFESGTEWSKLRKLYDLTKALSDQAINATSDGEVPSPRHSMAQEPGVILERHRHRYEVNPAYTERLAARGLHFIGRDEKGLRMEIIELQDDQHPYFVGVQFHPEYLSRVLDPSKPYLGFVAASGGCLEEVMERIRGQQVIGMVNGKGHRESISGLINGIDGVTV